MNSTLSLRSLTEGYCLETLEHIVSSNQVSPTVLKRKTILNATTYAQYEGSAGRRKLMCSLWYNCHFFWEIFLGGGQVFRFLAPSFDFQVSATKQSIMVCSPTWDCSKVEFAGTDHKLSKLWTHQSPGVFWQSFTQRCSSVSPTTVQKTAYGSWNCLFSLMATECLARFLILRTS